MKILVAMSGGVDSSVAALLLKQNGYDVTGITLKLWDENSRCCNLDDLISAHSIAHKLGIKHFTYNMKKPFYNNVIKYFIDYYKSAKTPNPCVICNQKIKIGMLLKLVKEWGYDKLATGHYSCIKKIDGKYYLSKAKDSKKSQEYFLSYVSKKDLPFLIFPNGNYLKDKIKEIAKEYKIFNKNRKESQDICFLPKNKGVNEVFPDKFPELRGKILDLKGKVIGFHRGYYFYTIGQRKGLGLRMGKPYYVIGLDPKNNIVYADVQEYLYRDSFIVKNLNIFDNELLKSNDIYVKIRFNSKLEKCCIIFKDNKLIVNLFNKIKAITPGQIACFYYNDLVIAAGEIDVLKKENYG